MFIYTNTDPQARGGNSRRPFSMAESRLLAALGDHDHKRTVQGVDHRLSSDLDVFRNDLTRRHFVRPELPNEAPRNSAVFVVLNENGHVRWTIQPWRKSVRRLLKNDLGEALCAKMWRKAVAAPHVFGGALVFSGRERLADHVKRSAMAPSNAGCAL